MRRLTMIVAALVCQSASVFAEDEWKLSAADQLPDGFSEKIVAMLDPQGIVVTGPGGPLCTVWLAKSWELKPKFKPSLTVKYPLLPGQLVGVVAVHSDSFADFRAQPVKPGVYTLRYGQQPTDGNHVGTSELSDFLLAIPAANDADPAVLKVKPLFKQSAKATGTNHPAIFSLLAPDEQAETPGLVHDAAKELWMLLLTGAGKQGDADVKVPLKLVILGKSEG